MALGSTQPLTETSTRNLPGGKGRPARKAGNLTSIWEPRRLTIPWVTTACYRDGVTLYLFFLNIHITGLYSGHVLGFYSGGTGLKCRPAYQPS
jgi:hypothetical protein